MKLAKQRGYITLIEMMIVICIVAIAGALIVPALTGWIDAPQQEQPVSKDGW